MVLDILFVVTVLLAIFKGWSKGLISGVFSLAALILGAAAALKLSAQFAHYLQTETRHPSALWPVVAFVLIFLLVALLVRLLAALIERLFQLVLLGWFNRLLGILFYAMAYAVIFSIGLWFADQLHLLSPELKEASRSYGLIAPLGPKVMAGLSEWIPWFKDLFQQLEDFFAKLSPLAMP